MSEQVMLGFLKHISNAFAPEKGTSNAAGFDLRSEYDYIVTTFGKNSYLNRFSLKFTRQLLWKFCS